MLDGRTKEEQRKTAEKCYATIKAKGRSSCAGCHLDYYCPMVEAMSDWLFNEFLPAIDPSGMNLR